MTDKSDYPEMTMFDRRQFVGALLACAAVAALPLPRGPREHETVRWKLDHNNFVDMGWKVGDTITVTGFSRNNNNGRFQIVEVSDGVVTWDGVEKA